MSPRLVVRPAAAADLREAFDWYEGRQPDLGRRFVEAVDLKFAQIQSNPRQFPVVRNNIRRAIVKRFPFAVFFVADETAVVILAVMHHSRAPLRWQRRV